MVGYNHDFNHHVLCSKCPLGSNSSSDSSESCKDYGEHCRHVTASMKLQFSMNDHLVIVCKLSFDKAMGVK